MVKQIIETNIQEQSIGNLTQDNFTQAETIQNEPEKKKKRWLLLLLLLLLLISFAISAWFLLLRPKAVPARTDVQDINRLVVGGDVQDGVFTKGMTAEEIEAAMQAVADKDNFNLVISPEMTFKNGQSAGNIQIVNPKTNVYPISVEITLQQDNSKIYESGLIKPEQYITSGLLLQNLPRGFYNALGTVTIYSEDGSKVNASTTVEMKLMVEN